MKKQLLICGLMLFSVSTYAQYRYNAPQQLDASPLVKAATTLQQRYNYNQKRFISAFQDIADRIVRITSTKEEENSLMEIVVDKCAKGSDFGSDYYTDMAIRKMYDCSTYYIKNQ